MRIAPRVLARLPSGGRPRAVLVGHRLADTGKALTDACAALDGAEVNAVDEDDLWPFIPRRLAVEVNSAEDLATLAHAIEAEFDPRAGRVAGATSGGDP